MKDNRFKWSLNNTSNVDLEALSNETHLDPTIVKILNSRGLDNLEDIKNFLNDDQSIIHDPFLMHDMQKAIDRIESAIADGSKILVYGDYDADGVTSTTIMYETLEQVGANVQSFVPNRFKDGYGPNIEEYKHFIEDEKVQLIVTVDNGIAGNEAIAYANEQGIDVIVTDHHEIPEVLPDAFAIVHPRHPEGQYPFGDLSGVGVAFKVACAMLDEVPTDFLDLYALGTVADLVSLTDENRFFVKQGIEVLRQSPRIGLKKLMDIAGVNTIELTEQDLGFMVAPRINAVGRLEDASEAVKLLTTFDEDEAGEIAEHINSINSKRQKIVQDVFNEAIIIANSSENTDRQTLVIAGHDWHQGILGIVASRIVEITNKPTIILSDQDGNGIYKGSGRSVESFNLFTALNRGRASYLSFGGHHMAIGISVDDEGINKLSEFLEEVATQEQLDCTQQPTLAVDAAVSISDLSKQVVSQLENIGPFGNGNPVPEFEIDHVQAKNVKVIGKDNTHLKFTIFADDQSMDVIAFNYGEFANVLDGISNTISLVGKIGTNEWRGQVSLQFMLDDIKIDGQKIVDKRTTNLSKDLFKDDVQYVFFNSKLKEIVQKQDIDRQLFDYDDPEIKSNDTIVLVDCPNNLESLKKILEAKQPDCLVLYFFHQVDYFASGMPSREDFKTLFAEIVKQDVSAKRFQQISQHLRISTEKIRFMFKVFLELGFVESKDGVISKCDNIENHDLSEAKIYQTRLQMIKLQEQLLYSKSSELTELIEKL